MEIEGDLGTPDCHEDATDLICGLIRELSSLKLVNVSIVLILSSSIQLLFNSNRIVDIDRK